MTAARRITTATEVCSRARNEDRFGVRVYDNAQRLMVGVVCDGIGGHAGGTEAAEAGLEAFLTTHARMTRERMKPKARLEIPLNAANEAVANWRKQDGHPDLIDMGTTLTAFEPNPRHAQSTRNHPDEQGEEMSSTRRITTATETCSRIRNEDRFGFRTYDHADGLMVGVVCDGIGGYAGGAEAAQAATDAFLATHAGLTGESVKPQDRLRRSLEAANEAVDTWRRQDGHPNLIEMGTTLIAFEFDRFSVRWISVGDSLLYIWAKDSERLIRLNTLHNAPFSTTRLTSALQGRHIPLIDINAVGVSVLPGDWVIAASDGLDTLEQAAIERAAANATYGTGPDLAARLMERVRLTNKRNQDNTTVVAVQAGAPRTATG